MRWKSSIIYLLPAIFLFFPAWLIGACTVSSTGVSFGSYNPLRDVDSDSTGTITISCTANSTVVIKIDASPNSGGFSPRQMRLTSGADLLSYNLYTTGARTTIWGNGTQGTGTLSRSVKKNNQWNAVVYGRVPSGQDVYFGQYSESLVVTINY